MLGTIGGGLPGGGDTRLALRGRAERRHGEGKERQQPKHGPQREHFDTLPPIGYRRQAGRQPGDEATRPGCLVSPTLVQGDGAGLHRTGGGSIVRRRPDRRWLAALTVEHFQELVDRDLPVGFRAGRESVRAAMLQMIGQRLLLDSVGRGAAAAKRKLALSDVAGFDSPSGKGVVGSALRLRGLGL